MSHTPPRRTALKALGGVIAAGAVGTAAYGSISSASAGGDLRSSLTLIAPAAAGGGWDTAARSMQQAQRAGGIVNNTQVVNIPGAGGTIALSSLAAQRGRAERLLVGGTGLLAATIQYDSATTLQDVTNLGVVVEENDVIVVPGDSELETLDDLVDAWKKDVGGVPWTGGGSFDQLVVTQLAVAAGVRGSDVNYIASDGGGEATQALLNGTAKAASSGYPDSVDMIESGRLKALALVAEEPIPGIDLPTTVDLGYDVTLTNWRSLHAPAGISDEEIADLLAIIEETVATPDWKESIEHYHWAENVVDRDGIEDFLGQQAETIRALYEELGV
ncbi:tricarboxylic transporter [Brachybacterium endophyticum]|uniref:Tricarboxylic transporter n=1 Tax=Brachybacterium endophyticum TaxID=2182385 RepID=A0A2U2RH26_9MICO|nr:tripartite tricarboxylate transporter substrate-binding protein [Brachybacterium endophyticum]PWH05075.1 tricarboxylic transporter [Brachybacterium endophyticum]